MCEFDIDKIRLGISVLESLPEVGGFQAYITVRLNLENVNYRYVARSIIMENDLDRYTLKYDPHFNKELYLSRVPTSKLKELKLKYG